MVSAYFRSLNGDPAEDFKSAPQGVSVAKSVYVVDDDSMVRRALFFTLTTGGYNPRSFRSGFDFLAEAATLPEGCVLLDLRMPELGGMEVLSALRQREIGLPVIVITGHGDVSNAVAAMKLGALDFLEKPFDDAMLFEVLAMAFDQISMLREPPSFADARERVSRLTPREYQVLQGLMAGLSNKQIGRHFNISVRTAELHRANLMGKMNASSFAEVLRLGMLGDVTPLADVGHSDGE